MSRRYPKEFHDFMAQYIPGHTTAEIVEETKKRFGIEISKSAVKSYKTNHKIRSGTPCGLPKGHPSEQFPQHVKDYIVKCYKGVGPKEMAERLNKSFGTTYSTKQLNGYYKNHGLNSGLTGRFEKGHVPQNKGKKIENVHPNSVATQFKVGHVPCNKMPIGAVIEKNDGYLWRKIGEGARDWRQEHILRWEEVHGALPEGGVITFLDGDRHNVNIDNLELIDQRVNLELNRRKLRLRNTALTRTAVLIARLNVAIGKSKKGDTK